MRVTLNSMLDRQMKALLRVGAAIIVMAAITALIWPSTLASALGLPLDLDPEKFLWSVRISAGLLLPLAGFMALAAAFFPERALRQCGALMIAFALILALLLVIAPIPWAWGRIACIALALLFSLLYLKALRARLRHR